MTYNERLNKMKELRRSLNNQRNNLEKKLNAVKKQCHEQIDGCKNSSAIEAYEGHLGSLDEKIHLDTALDNLDNIIGELKSQIEALKNLRNDESRRYSYLTYAYTAYEAQENLQILRDLTDIDPEVKQSLINDLYRNSAYKGFLN